MTQNAQRAIALFVFTLGLILGLLGWIWNVYAYNTGTILFIVCLLISIGLRIMLNYLYK